MVLVDKSPVLFGKFSTIIPKNRGSNTFSSLSRTEVNQEQKKQFKQIFRDGWVEFKEQHPRYEALDEVIEKMLGCGELENGYAEYVCLDCLERKQVAFSCKSSFCLSCAKTYTTHKCKLKDLAGVANH